ncbi:MAG: hypothetical protein BWK73_35510 [Thiothrix lacustris]|uniref:Acyltransferase 3 domain-containing protein n=1 Tax=Thiothrix lacustris TaxID=525917 RepID=A0A1Y1QG16_9GAMM|nr:MAG: hypothetical protein BWK73_35510 [Thiothrix lacustris]
MKKKLNYLEGIRGWAALVVFIHHFLLGFVPQRHGLIEGFIPEGNLKETPFFLLLNGSAAVTVFFVLSGFVLSLFLWENNDYVFRSVIKRWPRLILLPLISVIFVYCLNEYHLLYFKRAAVITHSSWMSDFAYSTNKGMITEGFADAFLQGSLFTFFRGDASLNSSLWTMNIEFIGSIIVFAFVAICSTQTLKNTIILAIIISMIFFFNNSYYYSAFLLGAILSKAHIGNKLEKIKNGMALRLALFTSIIFLGYVEPGTGFYTFMSHYGMDYVRIYLHSFSAAVVVLYCLKSESMRRYLSSNASIFLGRISFPLYVIHVPILFSLSSLLFINLIQALSYPISVALLFIVSLIACFAVAYVLSIVDKKWCELINYVFKPVNFSRK